MSTTDIQQSYESWKADPTPERLATTMRAMQPMITAEIQRYPGPKTVLRGRAKALAANAVRSYDPASGAKLSSWVTTQLQPLNRYGHDIAGSVRMPEAARRQAAELEVRRAELAENLGDEPTDEQLADDIGLSVPRVRQLRVLARPVITEGAMEDLAAGDSDEGPSSPGVDQTGTDPAMALARDMVHDELDERDRRIMEMRTGHNGSPVVDNMTIARRLGVSPALVSQRSAIIAARLLEAQRNV